MCVVYQYFVEKARFNERHTLNAESFAHYMNDYFLHKAVYYVHQIRHLFIDH